jgi:signal transduction histidine kinase
MKKFNPRAKIKTLLPSLQELLLHVLLASVITVSVMTFPLNFIEAPLYDLRQWLSIKPAIDDRIALITIDDQTLNQRNAVSPLPLADHLKAVEELERQGVKAVGYMVDFNKVQRVDPDAFETEMVQNFYRSTVRLNAQGVPFMLGIPYDVTGEVTAPYPLSQIPQAIAIVHRDGTIFGKDKVTRRGLVSLYDRMAFEMSLANRIYSNETVANPPGTYKATDTDAQYFLTRMHQNKEGVTYDPNYEVFAYPRYSFVDLIEGKVPPETLKDKIVLVGSFQRDNPNDFTLMSSLPFYGLTPKLLVQANILDSILNHQGIAEVPHAILAILCFLLSLTIIVASFKHRPSRLIFLTACLIVATFVLSVLLFQPIPVLGGLWLPLGAPLLSLTLSFYLMIPLRLYSEHRKRYELEKENQNLIEVEEMKTNFLQLVTHDLKTPIAKIQGLTETLKRSLFDNMTAKDHETMNNLFSANEELNHFINSLLELSKIDNQGVRVNLQSKDVNQILEGIVLKLRFGAQAKQIWVKTDFETLFPIKVDADLISKVLSNLIDNAIKYSPENTTVSLISREVENFVEIVIQDQGIGIPQSEMQNLFSRFYRVKNDTTFKVKGTGLGLYLSRYFIEAHCGTIAVESEPNEGTRFIVRLPMNLQPADLVVPGLRTAIQTNQDSRRKDKNYA